MADAGASQTNGLVRTDRRTQKRASAFRSRGKLAASDDVAREDRPSRRRNGRRRTLVVLSLVAHDQLRSHRLTCFARRQRHDESRVVITQQTGERAVAAPAALDRHIRVDRRRIRIRRRSMQFLGTTGRRLAGDRLRVRFCRRACSRRAWTATTGPSHSLVRRTRARTLAQPARTRRNRSRWNGQTDRRQRKPTGRQPGKTGHASSVRAPSTMSKHRGSVERREVGRRRT